MDTSRDLIPLARRAVAACAVLVSTLAPAGGQSASIGLSTVRVQFFTGEDLGIYLPAAGDHFGIAFATGDFNGDGAEDLATGVPNHDNFLGRHPDSGIVVVRYGVRGRGLAGGLAGEVLSQDLIGSPNPVDDGDHFGAALAACDFNGDGIDDLAVGIPGEDLPILQNSAGAVQVHYGSNAGIPEAGDLFFSQSSAGVPGSASTGDNFGSTLACGHFNGDASADLAVGVPHENLTVPTRTDAGMVVIVMGSPSGLDVASSSSFTQDSPDMVDLAATFDNFGGALTVADFNGDIFEDLAIGVPGDVNGGSDPETWHGSVHLVFGGVSGLTAAGNLRFLASGFGGIASAGDQFGSTLAAGDFDADGIGDLAVGTPFSDLSKNTIVDAGQVAVAYGTGAGFDNFQHWFQESVIGAGSSEAGDRFGFALAVGDFDRDGRADLAAGSPGEFQLSPDDGVVTVWMGTPTGLSTARHRSFDRGYNGVPGPLDDASREFGHTLAIGDFDGDTYADLVMGAPFADGTLLNLGDAVVLYGSLFADGFETVDSSFWTSTFP